MPTLQDLREQRANVWEQMKALIEKDSRTAEENQTYDRLERELDEKGEEITRREKHEAREKAEAESGRVDRSGVVPPRDGGGGEGRDTRPAEERYADAFSAFIRHGSSDLEPEERQTLAQHFVNGRELRDMGVATGAAGGYTVSPQFRNKLIDAIKSFGGMLNVAEVINTDTGANLQWPTSDDTGNVGAILAENAQVGTQDPTFGTNSIDAYMYTSKLVRTSLQLLQDGAFDVETWLARKLGERIGRILNQHFTTGTGTAQPDGLVTGVPVGVQATGAGGSTGTVTYDNLVDLIDSIDPAYQSGARFMMSTGARRVIRKLKDGQQRPLWEPSLQVGVPDSLLGYGLVLNQDMPAAATSAKGILFGDYREAYLVRLVTGVQLLRLAERYADFLQVGFLAFQRADGTLQNSAAVRAFQYSATA